MQPAAIAHDRSYNHALISFYWPGLAARRGSKGKSCLGTIWSKHGTGDIGPSFEETYGKGDPIVYWISEQYLLELHTSCSLGARTVFLCQVLVCWNKCRGCPLIKNLHERKQTAAKWRTKLHRSLDGGPKHGLHTIRRVVSFSPCQSTETTSQ